MRAPRNPMLHLVEVEPITIAPSSYIDYSVTNSILSGVIVSLLAAWAMVLFNRLWQGSIRMEAAEALEAAQQRGLAVAPDGLLARVVAEGAHGSERVRLEWRGGWKGLHMVVQRGDSVSIQPFISSSQQLAQALHVPES